jgi:hypothetical protein
MSSIDHPRRRWVIIGEVAGQLQAELVRGLLDAQDIAVHLTQEGAGRAFGLAVAPLGAVQILVPLPDREAAEIIFNDFLDGAFEDTIFTDDPGDIEP